MHIIYSDDMYNNILPSRNTILKLRKKSIIAEQFIWKENLISANISAPGHIIISGSNIINGIANINEIPQIQSYWNELADDPVYEFRKTRYTRIEIIGLNSEMNILPMKIFSIPEGQNAKLGTKPRKFLPNLNKFISSEFLLKFIWRIYDSLPLNIKEKNESYHVGVHPFRIIDNGDNKGLPTPEGIHRDGSQFVTVTLINRINVLNGSAISGIYTNNAIKGPTDTLSYNDLLYNKKQQLISHELIKPFDTILLNDDMVLHDATGVKQNDKTKNAIRDVLVLTWMTKKQDDDTPNSDKKY